MNVAAKKKVRRPSCLRMRVRFRQLVREEGAAMDSDMSSSGG